MAPAVTQTSPCPQPGVDPRPEDRGRYFGKYRGVVMNNVDPEGLGRILAEVPQVPGSLLNWAMPCVPYAGPNVGFYAIPPMEANVWIEFEGGNPNYPIWTGCFWLEGEFLLPRTLNPLDPALVKIFKTNTITLILNDTPEEGGVMLEITPPTLDAPATVTIGAVGIEVNYGASSVLITPEEGINLRVTETTVAMTEAVIEVNSSEINVSSKNVSVESAVEVEGNVEITGTVEVEGDVEITGAVEIEGDLEVTGATELEGDLEVTGATELAGELAVAGAAEFAGDLSVAGVADAAGDVAIAGAVEIVGDLAVLGLIEGVIVPPF